MNPYEFEEYEGSDYESDEFFDGACTWIACLIEDKPLPIPKQTTTDDSDFPF